MSKRALSHLKVPTATVLNQDNSTAVKLTLRFYLSQARQEPKMQKDVLSGYHVDWTQNRSHLDYLTKSPIIELVIVWGISFSRYSVSLVQLRN
ncbi:hypothetical protein F0237_10175 [Vibrio tubiashii]|uniref:Uncharacterized protein n=1 Tax=Vibrio tubiashii TaxID=29498 RepID=A0AAE5GQ29_9VIBR|nr:hypothetical protein [Vibrio tubiashii]NOI81028.1 hypothetical protein [Vibrio tubiashii]